MKNTVEQDTELHSGDTFTLKHGDEVVISVPVDVDLTVTEQNQEYTANFQLDDGESQQTNTMTFSITDDATLNVVNTLGMIVPTGIMNNIILPILNALMIFGCVAIILRKKKGFSSTNHL